MFNSNSSNVTQYICCRIIVWYEVQGLRYLISGMRYEVSVIKYQLHHNNNSVQDCSTVFDGVNNFYSVEGQPICGPCAGVGEV